MRLFRMLLPISCTFCLYRLFCDKNKALCPFRK